MLLDRDQKLEKLPEKDKDTYLSFCTKYLAFTSTCMLLIGMHNLGFTDGGMLGWIKTGLVGAAAFCVSYAVLRMAIEKGTTLSSVGYVSGAVLSGATLLLVGMTFFITTASGLALPSVEEARLADHIEAQKTYVGTRLSRTSGSTSLGPVVSAIAANLESNAACEVESSCVSGRGSGGYGPTARLLETLASRARSVATDMESGVGNYEDYQRQVSALLAQMDTVLANEELSIWDRRAELRNLDGYLIRLLSAVDSAVPSSLLAGYAQELRSGVGSSVQSDVATTINRLLDGYANSIETAIGGAPSTPAERPIFPSRSGAMDTFAYAGKLAPIFMLAALVDLTFPLALWAYTLLSLNWIRITANPSLANKPRVPTAYDKLTDIKTIETDDLPTGQSDTKKTPPDVSISPLNGSQPPKRRH